MPTLLSTNPHLMVKLLLLFFLHQYKIDFQFEDILEISNSKFLFLLQNLPLAVKLVNIIQKEKYELFYTDPPKNLTWKGTNNDDLSGWSSLFQGSFAMQNLHYLSFGTAKSIFGDFSGYALINLAFKEYSNNELRYQLKVTLFIPGSFYVFHLRQLDCQSNSKVSNQRCLKRYCSIK